MKISVLLAFVVLLSLPSLAQICSTGHEPVTINGNWTEEGCMAQSANGFGSTINCTAAGAALCHGTVIAMAHDVPVNVGDSVTSFCDEDGSITSGSWVINVVDNALGTGTVNTVNSGGNTAVTKSSGPNFTSGWVGGTMMIGANVYTISVFTDASHITLTGNAGTNTGSIYYAGNLFTKLPQADFNFANNQNGTFVIGNEFYVLGSTYAVSSGYSVACEFSNTVGSVGDMDTAFTVFRQTSGSASAGLQASTSWTQSMGSASTSSCGGNTCYLLGTTTAITVGANNLVMAIQQQNNATMPSTMNMGSVIGCDNDGSATAGSGFAGWYYTACSSTASAGSFTATMYGSNPSDNFTIGAFALKPSTAAPTSSGSVQGSVWKGAILR